MNEPGLIAHCGDTWDQCSACRALVAQFYDQFEVPRVPQVTQDYAALRALLETGLCERTLYYDQSSTASVQMPTVEVVHALGRAVLSLAARLDALEHKPVLVPPGKYDRQV